jgi:hypothetical protein
MSSTQNQKPSAIRKYRIVDFMLCNNCLWCASNISAYYPPRCPICKVDKIELIPISDSEAFGIKIESNGVAMEFWNS